MISVPEEIPLRILVVDDDRDIGQFICDFLINKGYEPLYADNGADAIQIIKRARPHIALLDIRMGGMDGLELLRRMQIIDPKIGPIMITAMKEDEVGREALKLGAIDYIAKPIDFDYLERSLTANIARLLG